MEILDPKIMEKVNIGAAYGCGCSEGSVDALIYGPGKCGCQCSYGTENGNANHNGGYMGKLRD